jgi:hypothetical protein
MRSESAAICRASYWSCSLVLGVASDIGVPSIIANMMPDE